MDGHFVRPGEADDQHFRPRLANRVGKSGHLDEVFAAGNSRQVPQKDQQQRLAREFGQPCVRTVRALERAVRNDVAKFHVKPFGGRSFVLFILRFRVGRQAFAADAACVGGGRWQRPPR